MTLSRDVLAWLPFVACLLGGLFLGWAIDRVLLGRLRRYAERSSWRFDEVILRAIGHAPFWWIAAVGVYAAYVTLPVELAPRAARLITDGLFVVVALSVTVVASRAAVAGVGLYSHRFEGVVPSVSIFNNLVKLLVFLVGGLIILQSLGISITPLLTALGVGGLAVGLALQDTLSNLFSGFQIVASRQIRAGDYIKLGGGEEGYVRDITWRYTTVQALTLQTVVIPNSKLVSSIVTNYHEPDETYTFRVDVAVGYDTDLERVEEVAREEARRAQAELAGMVPDYDPAIRFAAFGDSGIELRIFLRVTEFTHQFLARHEFIKRLHARFRREDIGIPFPTRTLTGSLELSGGFLAAAPETADGEGAGRRKG